MAKTVKITFHKPAMVAVVGGQSAEACKRAATSARKRAQNNIRKGGRVDTGEMVNGIVIENTTSDAMNPQYTVTSTAPHSIFQEAGTRAHGPRKAKFMAFQIRGQGPWIYAKWVRGVTALHFMEDAITSTRVSDFTK